jgi:hypothetical protein
MHWVSVSAISSSYKETTGESNTQPPMDVAVASHISFHHLTISQCRRTGLGYFSSAYYSLPWSCRNEPIYPQSTCVSSKLSRKLLKKWTGRTLRQRNFVMQVLVNVGALKFHQNKKLHNAVHILLLQSVCAFGRTSGSCLNNFQLSCARMRSEEPVLYRARGWRKQWWCRKFRSTGATSRRRCSNWPDVSEGSGAHHNMGGQRYTDVYCEL